MQHNSSQSQSAATSPVAFDFVAMLRNAPSATEVKASQSVAEQVRNAVGGHSPTAAVPPQAETFVIPERISETSEQVVGATPGKATSSGGTTLLGSFSATRPSQPLSAIPAVPRPAWLVRLSDGKRLRLPDENRSVVVGRVDNL